MNEKNLISSVDRHLSRTIYRQSMTAVTVTCAGTPDRYYDGKRSDLWVEYKQLKSMPRTKMAVGALTELQKHWLERRHANGGNAVVVVGLPNRTAVIQRSPDQWRNGAPITEAIPLKEVARWIAEFCGE